ncbi:MAG: SDR family NAD(P)-dependent oxidoreductase [Actinomycetota bacterium]|nr:SDR family NAD(P)-dependent oxidoreductase [Actinomycetota bacterium]
MSVDSPKDLLRRGADAALEATIVPSFTKIGPTIRRRLWDWQDPKPASLSGQVVVITGGTSGIGACIAEGVGRAGATLELIGRDEDKGADAVATLRDRGIAARFRQCDVSELDQVRSLADDLASDHDRIRALVLNAGALLHERKTTSDGLEVTWASMVVGHHLLIRMLADRTERAVWMSSGGMYVQDVDLDDLGWEQREWQGSRVYAQAKRAQVDLAREAAARREEPVQVSMHPGWADTPGVEMGLPGFRKVMGPLLRDPADGADTAVWLVTAPLDELDPGAFYLDRRPRNTVRWPGTATSDGERLTLRRVVDHQAGLPTG